MQAHAIDERHLVHEVPTANYLAYFFVGGDRARTSWSVHSHLLTDCQLPEALRWLASHVPTNACWALGVVLEPERPTAGSDVRVAWIIGADVLNTDPRDRTAREQHIADEMLARRNRVDLP
jgi:hypothetical protein